MKSPISPRLPSLPLRLTAWLLAVQLTCSPGIAYAHALGLEFRGLQGLGNGLGSGLSRAKNWLATWSTASAAEPAREFSKNPADGEFAAFRILPEPLIPVGATSPAENQALAKALKRYRVVAMQDDYSPLTGFLDAYPQSAWRASLMVNMGLLYRNAGYFTRALDAWEEAWLLGSTVIEQPASGLMEYGLGHLLEMNSRLGRLERIEALLDEVQGRLFMGSTTERVAGAREALWIMHQRPETAFLCGPTAVENVRARLHPGTPMPLCVESARSTPSGSSLLGLLEIAQEAGLNYQMAHRSPRASLLTPAVVHWKAGHYAALMEEKEGRLRIVDPTFGSELWMTRTAFDEEASGFMLVPAGRLPRGWSAVNEAQGVAVWGKGICYSGEQEETRPCDTKIGGDQSECGGSSGMPRYSVHALLVSLNIVDTPVSYTPPKGLPLDFRLTYNQRDAGQGSGTFNYSNLGSKWTFNWLAYVTDKLGTPDNQAQYYTPGGGYEQYGNLNTGNGYFGTQLKSRAMLQRTPANPAVTATSYTLTFPDGSKQIFSRSDNAPWNRKMFMTSMIDPQGNTLTFTYTGNNVTRVDAASAYALLDYAGLDPNKITKVRIFVQGVESRSATFEYDIRGRLARVTDAAGLSSFLTYADYTPDYYGYDLQLLSVSDASAIPATGNLLVIIARYGAENTLHFRVFDGAGTKVFDRSETGLQNKSAELNVLKAQLAPLWGQQEFTSEQKNVIFNSVAPITGPHYNSADYDPNVAADFITRMDTPYGATLFSQRPPGGMGNQILSGNFDGQHTQFATRLNPAPGDPSTQDRWLTITDALGGRERFVYRLFSEPSQVATAESPGTVPSGMLTQTADTDGQWLQYRNTFYWNKEAMRQEADSGKPDYSKARILHWLHSYNLNVAAGVLESEKMPLERRVWYDYPAQTAATILPSGAGAQARPRRIGRVLADGTTQLYEFEYNELGRVTRIIAPDYRDGTMPTPVRRETTFTYDPGNLIDLLEVRQRTGGINQLLARFTYQAGGKHLVQTAVDAAGQTTQFLYNASGQPTSITSPKGEVTELRYAASGFLEKIIAPAFGTLTEPQRTTTFAPDSMLRIASVTDPDGYTVRLEYDNLDRITKIIYPDNDPVNDPDYEQIVYDKLDPVLTRDRSGRWAAMQYDALRHVVAIKDTLGRTTQLDWCTCDALISLVDPLGQVTFWDRDLQGRVTRKIHSDGTQTSYNYDEGVTSRLLSVTDAKNQTTHYSYYADDSLNSVTYSGSSVATPGVSFTYDTAYQRVKTMTDGTGTTVFTYKPIIPLSTPPTQPELAAARGAGQLQQIDSPLANDVIAFTYDELGRVASRTINGAANSQSVIYDSLGRVSSANNALGAFTYGYQLGSDRLASIAYPGGAMNVTLGYWPKVNNANDLRLQYINHASGATTLSRFDYDYDTEGQITSWTLQQDPIAANKMVMTLSYDAVDQFAGAVLKNASGTIKKEFGYSYDPAGNRTSEYVRPSVDGAPGVYWANTATHNNVNAFVKRTTGQRRTITGAVSESGTTVTINGVPATVNGTGYSGQATVSLDQTKITVVVRDSSGNASTRSEVFTGTITGHGLNLDLTYDLNGNLVRSAVDANNYDRYEWDAADRLVAFERYASAVRQSRSEFTYDGLGRRVMIVERDGAGAAISAKRFLWCGMEICEERDSTGSTVTKQYFSQGFKQGSTVYFYTRDHLGSIRELVNTSGGVVSRFDYDPYGKRTLTGSVDADFGFTGHYTHSASGLCLAPFRAYSSEFGRWLSRDPLEERFDRNVYRFAYNNPIGVVDLTGLWGIWFGGLHIGSGNPNLVFDRDSLTDVGQGAMATADGLVPFWDPFKGRYDPCDSSLKFSRGAGEVAQFALTSAFSGGAVKLLSQTAKPGGIVLASKAKTGGWISRMHTARYGPFGRTYEAFAIKNVIRLEGHPYGGGLSKALGLMRPHLHLDFWAKAPHHLSLEPLFGALGLAADKMFGQQGGCP